MVIIHIIMVIVVSYHHHTHQTDAKRSAHTHTIQVIWLCIEEAPSLHKPTQPNNNQ